MKVKLLLVLTPFLALAACDGLWVRSIDISPVDASPNAQMMKLRNGIAQTVSDVAKNYGYLCQLGHTVFVFSSGAPVSHCDRAGYETIDVTEYPDVYEVSVVIMHPGPFGSPPQYFISLTDDLVKALSAKYGSSVKVTNGFPDHKPKN